MPQTIVLIDYDVQTGNITRIIHPDDDSEIVHHPPQPERGWGRVQAPHHNFPIDAITHKPIYSLKDCADYVQQVTGRRPPNG